MHELAEGEIGEEAAEAAADSTISVTTLDGWLKERADGGRDFVLVDVREPVEYDINRIPGSVLIPKGEFLSGSALEKLPADVYAMMRNKFWIDEIYGWTVIRFNAWFAKACGFLDEWIWGGAVALTSYATLALAWLNRAFDEFVINLGFDQGCDRVAKGGSVLSRLQDGRVQNYLRIIGVTLVVLVLFLIWGGGK